MRHRENVLALLTSAHKALCKYVQRASKSGPDNSSIVGAVNLTLKQRDALSAALTKYWKRPYLCPKTLDIKPRHGFESRVLKDGFSAETYVDWLALGCSDSAVVDTNEQLGRARLATYGVSDTLGERYDILVLISSDAHGRVHIFDVIPRGLEPRRKKTAPSANP